MARFCLFEKKSNFYTPRGYKTLVIIFEEGLFKTEPYWKKTALPQSYAGRLCTACSCPQGPDDSHDSTTQTRASTCVFSVGDVSS